MIGRVLAACAALLWPLAGFAQEPEGVGAEFSAAFAEYYPSGDAESVLVETLGLQIVAQVEGLWVPGQILFSDGTFEAEQFTRSCEIIGFEIAPSGRFGFTMTPISRGEPTNAVTTYAFVGASTFALTTDLEGVIERIFGDMDIEVMDPRMWLGVLNGSMNHGYATVRMESDNILVIQPVGSPPHLLIRCP